MCRDTVLITTDETYRQRPMRDQRQRSRLCGRLVRARSLQLMIAPDSRPSSQIGRSIRLPRLPRRLVRDAYLSFSSLTKPRRFLSRERAFRTASEVLGSPPKPDLAANFTPLITCRRVFARQICPIVTPANGRTGTSLHGIAACVHDRPRPPPRAEVSRRFRLLDADSEILGDALSPAKANLLDGNT